MRDHIAVVFFSFFFFFRSCIHQCRCRECQQQFDCSHLSKKEDSQKTQQQLTKSMRHMKNVGLLLFAFALLTSTACCGVLSPDDVARMSLKDIRAALKARRVSCDDCVEKEHFRAKLVEVLAAAPPVEEAPQPPTQEDSAPAADEPAATKKPSDDEKLDPELMEQLRSAYRKKKNDKDDIMAKLRKAGINAHTFDPNDMDSLSDMIGGKRKNARTPPRSPQGTKPTPPLRGDKTMKKKPSQILLDDDAISDEL